MRNFKQNAIFCRKRRDVPAASWSVGTAKLTACKSAGKVQNS